MLYCERSEEDRERNRASGREGEKRERKGRHEGEKVCMCIIECEWKEIGRGTENVFSPCHPSHAPSLSTLLFFSHSHFLPHSHYNIRHAHTGV